MIKISRRVPLAPYTTIKVSSQASFFTTVNNLAELQEAIAWAKKNNKEILVLGGGSNFLLTKPFKGLVIKNEITGSEVLKETAKSAWYCGYSGENWSRFVSGAVRRHWYGLENLFLIYGTVGAAPVQNIGAYGVELKDSFVSLEAVNLRTGKLKVFSAADCHFGYRDSVFKNRLKGKYFIYKVTVKLSKTPQLKTEYGDIKATLERKNIKQPTLQQMIEVIQEIRLSKLPTPAVLANAGSFFKNPEIKLGAFKKIQTKFPDIKYFPGSRPDLIKIPAGWLIEQAGFKGKRFGRVGMYEKQALILINYGGATPAEILVQVKRVIDGVKKRFDLTLEPEVNIIPPLKK